MNINEIKDLQTRDDLPFAIVNRSNYLGRISINNFIALPVYSINSSLSKNSEIELLDLSGEYFGYIVWTKTHEYVDLNQITELEFICYLTELETISDYGIPYKLDNNYVLIKRSFYKEYLKDYHSTSSIWGGYTTLDQLPQGFTQFKTSVTQIQLSNPIEFDHPYLVETSRKATEATTGLERFLKLYHLLELIFDFNSFKEIQSLDIISDQIRIGKIFHEYKRDDVKRLIHLLESKLLNIDIIIPLLNNVRLYPSRSKSLFYDFGKDSNPIKEYSKFQAISIHPDGFTEVNCNSNGLAKHSYRAFIIKLASYWIYRIRCSIAHNKIGEYVMTSDDEEFVVEFGEPLIKSILIQVFKK